MTKEWAERPSGLDWSFWDYGNRCIEPIDLDFNHWATDDGWEGGFEECKKEIERQEKKSNQLNAAVENGQLKITIGVNLLAWAVQCGWSEWPEDHYIESPEEFAKMMAKYLMYDDEQGTTELHKVFDKAALDMFESGELVFVEGDVQKGLDLIDGKT